jgi:hypothetical protein
MIIPEPVINLFQNSLSRHMTALDSPGDQGHFWSLGASKMFETSHLHGFGIVTWIDQGRETSAPTSNYKVSGTTT